MRKLLTSIQARLLPAGLLRVGRLLFQVVSDYGSSRAGQEESDSDIRLLGSDYSQDQSQSTANFAKSCGVSLGLG